MSLTSTVLTSPSCGFQAKPCISQSHLLVDRSHLPPKIDLGYQLQTTHPTQVTQSSFLVMFQLPPAPCLTSGHSQSWSSPTGLVTLTTHLGLDKGQSWPQRSQSSSLTQRPNSSTHCYLRVITRCQQLTPGAIFSLIPRLLQ